MTAQRWNPEQYVRDADFVARLGEPLIALLAPKKQERILDLGCGDGALTVVLAASGARMIGVDASAEQVAATRARGLEALTMSGEALGFVDAFDAVFSNAALHWMKSPERVIAGVARALVPAGRFVAECGGAGNVRALRTALWEALARRGIDASALDPWYFPEPEAYRALLEAGGFTVEQLTLFPRPTPLPGDVRAWLRMFAHSFTSALSSAEYGAFLDEVAEAVAPTLRGADGAWTADYVRLRFVARKQ